MDLMNDTTATSASLARKRRRATDPALTRAVNQSAHRLASQSFQAYRVILDQRAGEMLANGRTVADTIAAIQMFQLDSRARASV